MIWEVSKGQSLYHLFQQERVCLIMLSAKPTQTQTRTCDAHTWSRQAMYKYFIEQADLRGGTVMTFRKPEISGETTYSAYVQRHAFQLFDTTTYNSLGLPGCENGESSKMQWNWKRGRSH